VQPEPRLSILRNLDLVVQPGGADQAGVTLGNVDGEIGSV